VDKWREKLKTWIWSIAINHCKDYRRRWYTRNVMASEKIPDSSTGAKEVEDQIEEIEMKEDISLAVLSLPVKYREVVFLHYFEQMTFKEIEAITGIRMNTIKTRMRRAKELLKQRLEGKLSEVAI
jgi:RNA polymerase sigma-70 factor, ECF subfamily